MPGFRVKAQILGAGPLIARLDRVRRGVRNKILRPAVGAAGKIVLKQAKQLAPLWRNAASNLSPQKLLRKALGRKVKVYPNGSVVAIVGPRKGFKQQIGVRVKTSTKPTKRGHVTQAGDPIYEDPANIAHLVEHGHGGPHPAPEHGFLIQALNDTRAEASDAVVQKIAEGVEKELKA